MPSRRQSTPWATRSGVPASRAAWMGHSSGGEGVPSGLVSYAAVDGATMRLRATTGSTKRSASR
ncbi:MAG: hypothetical protein ACRDZQ_08475, partial [Acidimicrobiales bacterium]